MRILGLEVRRARPIGRVRINESKDGKRFYEATSPSGAVFVQKFPWDDFLAESEAKAWDDLINVDWQAAE